MMTMLARPVMLAIAIFALTGCGQAPKIADLEKENQELKAEMEKYRATAEYDLQARCSKDSKAWFDENWSRDKDTLLLDFTNHYSKPQNKCFIEVEYNYAFGSNDSWMSHVSVWDVYENLKYADFGESHVTYFELAAENDRVMNCEVYGTTCKTIDEFNRLVRS